MISPMVAEAMTAIGTVTILFVLFFLPIAIAARNPNSRAAELRAARLKELKKYSIRLLDLR
jgi:hypothetical protein